jgi:hypothetical protein
MKTGKPKKFMKSFEPRSFSSSRGKRAAVVQSAEDFMDEEDLRTMRERVVIAREGQGSDEHHVTATSGPSMPLGLQVLRRLQRAGTAVRTAPELPGVPARARDCLWGVGYVPPPSIDGLGEEEGEHVEVLLAGEEARSGRLNDPGAFRGESEFEVAFVRAKNVQEVPRWERKAEDVVAVAVVGEEEKERPLEGRKKAPSLAYRAAKFSHQAASSAVAPPPVELQLRTVQDLGSRFTTTTTLSSEISEQRQAPPPPAHPPPAPAKEPPAAPRRSFESWQPAPLLSKRMNVKPIAPSEPQQAPMASQLHSFVQSLLTAQKK